MLMMCILGCQRVPVLEIVVWSAFKDQELELLKKEGAAFAAREGIPVRVVRVPFEELQPKIQVSVPVGQGPDLITGPHDWIGRFVTADLIAPVDFPAADLEPFLPVSLDTMRYEGKFYGLPLSVTAIGLVTNRGLLPTPPDTMAELIAQARKLTDGQRYGFLFDDLDFYFAYPVFGGYGATLFTPGQDDAKVGLASEGAVRAAQFLADLHLKEKLMPVGTTKNTANDRFLRGECAMTITGPWALREYRDQKIDYVFTPIPRLDNGRWPTPLVGVDGVMLARSSRNPDLARGLMLALADREAQVQLNLAAGRIPARRDAQADPRVASNPDVQAIGRSVEKGTPMPSIPAMAQVWQPMQDALKLVTSGKVAAPDALREAVERIETNVRMMKR